MCNPLAEDQLELGSLYSDNITIFFNVYKITLSGDTFKAKTKIVVIYYV